MRLNIAKEVAAMRRMTMKALRARYAQAFGDTTNAANRAWLVKRIAWRLQALADGDLSERARHRAQELARDADLRLLPPRVKTLSAEGALMAAERTVTGTLSDKPDGRLPLPGTIITREY